MFPGVAYLLDLLVSSPRFFIVYTGILYRLPSNPCLIALIQLGVGHKHGRLLKDR